MTVSGGIKFFRKNRGDIDDENATAAVSTGSATRDYARNRKRYLRWESVGSDDITTETYELRFGAAYDIDRIILNRHNFKAFFVKYWDGAAWKHFANVITKEGAQANITETVNTKTTNYYEFTSVNTEKIIVSIDTTQSVDDEKYMYECISTEELGTFTGYPIYAGTFEKKRAFKEAFNGRVAQSILGENFKCSLRFNTYPTASDHVIVNALWDIDKEFLIYPCGANEDQYRYTSMIGNRLRDIYLVGIRGDLTPIYERNVYVNSLNYKVDLVEVP